MKREKRNAISDAKTNLASQFFHKKVMNLFLLGKPVKCCSICINFVAMCEEERHFHYTVIPSIGE